MTKHDSKSFQRATRESSVRESLLSRFKPVYDNTFDDLIEKLNQIDFKRKA